MRFTLFIAHYIAWHYSAGLKSFLSTWTNIMWFAYHFFSIPLLLRTLFSPFQRLNEEYKKGFDIAEIMSSLTVNVIMRLVGAVARGFIITLGLVFLAVIVVAGTALFAAWLLLPFSILTFIMLGINGLVML